MENFEKEIFQLLFTIAEITGKELKPDIANIYIQKLRHVPSHILLSALNNCISTQSSFPSIATILDKCGMNIQSSHAALNAACQIIQVVSRKGFTNCKKEYFSELEWKVIEKYGGLWKICYEEQPYIVKNLERIAKQIIDEENVNKPKMLQDVK